MVKEVNEFVEEVNELMTFCVKEIVDPDMFEYMNETTIEMYKRTIKLFKKSTDLLLEQARLMDQMNGKLDLLLERSKES